MLLRLRSIVRRRPQALVALVLAVVGAQGMAGTLSWCLNDAAPRVVSSIGPCHAQSGIADPVNAGDPPAPLPHVSAATDAGLTNAAVGVAAVGPSPVLFRLQADSDLRVGSGSAPAAAGRSGVLCDAGPPVDPASPGHAVRLLI